MLSELRAGRGRRVFTWTARSSCARSGWFLGSERGGLDVAPGAGRVIPVISGTASVHSSYKESYVTTASDTPVLDTLAAMTMDSIERCGLPQDMLILTRIAALAAMDAPPLSYLAHIEPAMKASITADRLQDVLIAITPIVGTARVMSAAGHIAEALGIAITVADQDAQSKR